MKEILSEENRILLKKEIELHKLSRTILREWREKLMIICKGCIARHEDDATPSSRCDCEVQFFLDMILDMLNGNGH